MHFADTLLKTQLPEIHNLCVCKKRHILQLDHIKLLLRITKNNAAASFLFEHEETKCLTFLPGAVNMAHIAAV